MMMINRTLKNISTLFLIGTFAIFAGCDLADTSPDAFGEGAIQMMANANNTNAKSQSSITNQGNIVATDGNNEIEIHEVKFFLDEFELDGANGTSDFELEELNDFIVNLPLDGSPITISQAEIPAGFYDEFEMEIEKPDSDIEVTDRDFRDETGSYSVVVKGFFNGNEFTFRSSEDFEINVDLNPPLEISETSQSTLVVNIYVATWFTGDDGLIMDPKDAMNTEKINDNIEKSFEAFEDSFED
ncbi:MAG: hypothetical protein EA390_00610 [Balneolaceae bacterium]|nr:MAG: hypothetical protein EA390_00610 [Balneolaceae bacterium]